jgi:hypothetical protein
MKPANLVAGFFLFLYICSKNNELYFDQSVNRYIVPLKKVLPPGGDVNFITLDTELKKEFKKYGLDKFNTYKQKQIIDKFIEGECVVSFSW